MTLTRQSLKRLPQSGTEVGIDGTFMHGKASIYTKACQKQLNFDRFSGSVFGSGLDLTGSRNLSGQALCTVFNSE
jgi:hypothetical protein